MDLPNSTRQTYSINEIWLAYPLIGSVISCVVLFIYSIVIFLLFPSLIANPASTGLMMVLFVSWAMFFMTYFLFSLGRFFSIIYQYLYLKSFKLILDENNLVVESGILSRSERTIPYGVIQNIIISKDLIDHIFGTASVQIENASNSGMMAVSSSSNIALSNQVSLLCLTMADASELRLKLINKVISFSQHTSSLGL